MVWCTNCGSWASSRYRALGELCPKTPATALQRLALRRIARGLPPLGSDMSVMIEGSRTAALAGELEV